MIEKIATFIKDNSLILPNDRIIAAVSGGVDSMVMLFCLNSLKHDLNFELSVIHINHGVRPGDSDKDEKLVRDCCQLNGLEFKVRKLDGYNLDSSEESLREARYGIFNEVLLKHPDAKIATAHTLDDQVETFLMRLAKGSKIKGLCGIPVKRDAFIRPMLGVTKQELYLYAGDKNIPFCEDYTNKDLKKMRNQIRHRLIPVIIEIFGENFYEGFKRSRQDLSDVYSVFTKLMQMTFNKYVTEQANGLEMDIIQYQKLSVPERRQLLNGCISKFYPLNFQIRSTYFEQFEKFVNDASTGRQIQFDNNLICVKNRASIFFTIHQTQLSHELELYPGQVVCIGRNKISLKKVEDDDIAINDNKNCELVCGDKIHMPLKVRFWQQGDFFYPLGMKGKQKVSDFFINQKVNQMEKGKIPLVVNQSQIVWIAGLRLDDRYKFTKECKIVYKLEIDGNN